MISRPSLRLESCDYRELPPKRFALALPLKPSISVAAVPSRRRPGTITAQVRSVCAQAKLPEVEMTTIQTGSKLRDTARDETATLIASNKVEGTAVYGA